MDVSDDSCASISSIPSISSTTSTSTIGPEENELRKDLKILLKLGTQDGFKSETNDAESSASVSTIDIEVIEQKRELRRLEKLEAKRKAEEIANQARKERALKSMNYLLGISEKYSNFFKTKILNSTESKTKTYLTEKNKFQPTVQDMKELKKVEHVKKEKREYSDLLKHLKYFENGSLRPYQVEGVSWMTVLFENGLNGILADEMGLGKTVQIIALIGHLIERKIPGPYLIVAPLSTLPNWESEFKRFAPKLPVVLFHGSQSARVNRYKEIKRKYLLDGEKIAPVVLTAYHIPLREDYFLKQFAWQYIIVDEGHRIKNHESKLSLILRSFQSVNRLLLTGTPLQNNITELWALLNFLLPHIFNNMDTFAALFMVEDMKDSDKLVEQEQSTNMISTIHKVLAPFMLRRLKKDVLINMVPKKEVFVYCPMSNLQKNLYSYVIDNNIAKLRGQIDEEEEIDINTPRAKRKCTQNRKYSYFIGSVEEDDFSDVEEAMSKEQVITEEKVDKKTAEFIIRLTMTNTMMMFKKIVDHPYLVHFPLDPNSDVRELLINENIVNESGKMIVLDAMLRKLKQQGHKVLIFSTLVMLLDLVEDFLLMRGYSYCRLDGSRKLEERAVSINSFNTNPEVFAFIISTRAGGLGVNLTGADTVIFFDRDWNPQSDIQAQDRCHRIGQTKPVMVYTLVTKNTIDEKIITCGNMKRRLEKIVIKDGKFKTLNDEDKNKAENELLELKELLNSDQSHDGYCFSTSELDRLLDRSELYEQMQQNKEN